MKFILYKDLLRELPEDGRHIAGTFDSKHIVVYQGFNKEIAKSAIQNGYFSAPFSFSRLSWIKPNFTWMMYRSEWGLMEEYILAVYLTREFFERILKQAVYTQYCPQNYQNIDEWKTAVKKSDVRIQWDPDHGPKGESLKRRAIQLGLQGKMLNEYAKRSIVKIVDVSNFVREQRNFALSGNYSRLKVPEEKVYMPKSKGVRDYLGLSD